MACDRSLTLLIVTSNTANPRPAPPALVAAGVCLVESALLVATALLYALELLGDLAEEAGTASMSLALCVIFAILLAVLAAAWFKGATWPRTPTVVWNVLLLPAAWTLVTASGIWIGVGVAAVAATGIVAALLAPTPELPDRAL